MNAEGIEAPPNKGMKLTKPGELRSFAAYPRCWTDKKGDGWNGTDTSPEAEVSHAPQYPNDADGDALRRVLADGSDMSKPMEIDFAVAVPSREAGERVAEQAKQRGFRVDLVPDAHEEEPDATTWTCYCTKTMVPEYDELLSVQRELDDLSKPFGGWSDGWGTFGNAPPKSTPPAHE